MFQNVLQVSQLVVLRFMTRLLLKIKMYKEPKNIMRTFHSRFVDKGFLNDDLTKGTNSSHQSIIQDLVHSFVSMRHYRNQEGFYIQVAKDWVQDLHSTNHRFSILFVIAYLLLLSSAFVNHYIEVIPGGLWLYGIFLLPIIGFVIALGGRGWKRWSLLLAHLLLFTYSIAIVA